MREAARALCAALDGAGDPARAEHLQRFFRTGPGEYGEGDRFLGLRVPEVRAIARRHRELSLADLAEVLASPWHEHRQAALFVLADRYRRATPAEREPIASFYLEHLDAVNSWDLVDGSAPHILGAHLLNRDRAVLYELAASRHLWRQRVAVLATFAFIRAGQFQDTLRLAELLRDHPHDLIHKAVGWMLREIGKRDLAAEERFLDRHAARMPRTMLRYAIEKFEPERRRSYLQRRS
ncbi:MAG: DNA alkylation repair protein [Spirochaetaceae bacterium]|nr:DNA alkylation repair protein [Spirochaetaceae bacterium]